MIQVSVRLTVIDFFLYIFKKKKLINKTLFLFMYLKRDNYFGLFLLMNEILLILQI